MQVNKREAPESRSWRSRNPPAFEPCHACVRVGECHRVEGEPGAGRRARNRRRRLVKHLPGSLPEKQAQDDPRADRCCCDRHTDCAQQPPARDTCVSRPLRMFGSVLPVALRLLDARCGPARDVLRPCCLACHGRWLPALRSNRRNRFNAKCTGLEAPPRRRGCIVFLGFRNRLRKRTKSLTMRLSNWCNAKRIAQWLFHHEKAIFIDVFLNRGPGEQVFVRGVDVNAT